MTHQVPRLDLKTCTANTLVETLSQHSCVLLENHTVNSTVLQSMLNSWDGFFALPRSEKDKVKWPGDGPWYGWQPVSEDGPKADLMERFELRLDSKLEQADRLAWADTFPLWPKEPVEFQAAWSTLYFALWDVASHVMRMIAEGIGRQDLDMHAWTDKQHSNLVANHYYAQPVDPNRGQWRAHAHKDIGAITLLWADDAPGGLEVAINQGRDWVPVMIPPDCWLLQVGDLLELWSGGRIPANLHRVANPPRELAVHARRSIVFFHHPSPEVIVTPPDGDPEKAVSAEAHIQFRQEEDYTQAL